MHVLGDADRVELSGLIDQDPIVNAVLASRVHALRTLEPGTFGGALLGTRNDDGELTAAVFNGGNLLPIAGSTQAWHVLAAHLRLGDRACSSIVGRAEAVDALWSVLAPAWGPARTIRAKQPLLALGKADRPPRSDHRVRPIRADEVEQYFPAAVAMFTEELGISPLSAAGTGDYHRRIAGLVRAGRAFGIVDLENEVIFKADIGAVSGHTCQVQGVWVRPNLRGRGIGTAALAAVLQHALTLAPTVSLYVNNFNVAACRMYDRLGMHQVAELSTILF